MSNKINFELIKTNLKLILIPVVVVLLLGGILLYYYKHGAHFTMYRKIDLDKYQFINAVYGRKIVLTPEEFMKKYTILHIGTIIYM